jgi:hypothetical protein
MHIPIENFSSLPLVGLYAETHFRFFRFFPSILYARWPEVIFDVPKRLAPGRDLPVLLIANDLSRFPAIFADCAIAVSRPGATPQKIDFPDIDKYEVSHPLRSNMRAFVLPVPRAALEDGLVHVTCCVTITCGNRKQVVVNDNLRTTRKLSFSCYIADKALPGSEFCGYGDLHVHSNYSQSHVEFGPPISVIDAMAHAMGLSFVGITDHSYDLACSMDDYLVDDPERVRWQTFQREIHDTTYKTTMIPGEEVSCLNGRNEVVHLGGLGLNEYLPGSLDGARKGRRAAPQSTIPEAVNAIHGQKGIVFAAHPGGRPGFLQRLLLYRGQWSASDLGQDIDAMQILNDGYSPSFLRGRALWIEQLLRGRRVPLLAGNDAHGDFNRYRALAVPFLSIGENSGRYMGCGRTGVYGQRTDAAGLVDAIREGKTFITTGPFAAIASSASPEASLIGNMAAPDNITALFVHAISTPESGAVRSVELYADEKGSAAEKKVFSRRYTEAAFNVCEKVELASLPQKPMYVRAEISCGNGCAGESRALTSAVFLG